jgi:hypothetical protein
LRGYGEQAVVARAGRRGDSLGDFALDHEHGAVKRSATGGQFEHDLRGDVVGQVAEDEQRMACLGGCRGEVKVENVLLVDSELVGGEAGAEMGCEAWIKLDGDDVRGACHQSRCDGAGAGPDLDDCAASEIAEG